VTVRPVTVRPMTLRSAVVAVGEELLLGDVVNGNAAWLGAVLAAAGAPVVHSSAVGDDVDRIVTALRRAAEDAEVVLVTGGLGPTSDDRTREALARLADVPLDRLPELEQRLRDRFASFGRPLQDQVLRQADVPRGAVPLDNPVGTAPGLRLEVDGRVVFALPGPPHELAAVATASVLPELARRTGTTLVTRTLHCAGAGESDVAARVEQALTVPDGVVLAYLAGNGIVRVRLSAAGASAEQVAARLDPLVDAAAAALGDAVFGRDDDTLAGVVLRGLRERDASVAVAESLTAGLLGAALTAVAGSSAVFRGGLLVYATDLKQTLAGVPGPLISAHGAVSAQVAGAMAAGVRERVGATYGVALTGVAGPDEQEGQPIGTVHVAVSGPDGAAVRSLRLPGDRDRVRALAVTTALDLLRRQLR
jgi:nicotinamide-nucleotide amidase